MAPSSSPVTDRHRRSQPSEKSVLGGNNLDSPPRLVKKTSAAQQQESNDSAGPATKESSVKGKEKEQHHLHQKPPMNVIVVSSPTSSREEREMGGRQESGVPFSGTSKTTDAPGGSSSFSTSPFSTPFRLQPRKPMAISAPGRDGAIRGRKRSAQSMITSASNLTAREALLTSSARGLYSSPATKAASGGKIGRENSSNSGSTTEDETLSATRTSSFQTLSSESPAGGIGAATPPRTIQNAVASNNSPKRPGEVLDMNFQNLSLRSPQSRRYHSHHPAQSPPHSSSNEKHTPHCQRSAASIPVRPSPFKPVHPNVTSSPEAASFRSLGSGSLGSNAKMTACSGSAKSSPKIAPLTVLTNNNNSSSSTNSRSGGSPNTKSSDSSKQQRPPLPNGAAMSSLWDSMETTRNEECQEHGNNKATRDNRGLLPPKTVHVLRPPTSDSFSIGQGDVLSPLPTHPMHLRSPGGGFMFMMSSSPSAFASPSAIRPSMSATSTPRSKQARHGQYSSPGTPRTPLPRVTLTPRSSGSRVSRGNELPRFPSPSDIEDDMDVASPFFPSNGGPVSATLRNNINMRSTGTDGGMERQPGRQMGAMRSLFPAESSNSLALSADGSVRRNEGSSKKKPSTLPILAHTEEDNEDNDNTKGANRGGTYPNIRTTSLLAPGDSPGGIMRSIMAMEERNSGNSGQYMRDMDSISDIDDDDDDCKGFILASPGALEQERLTNIQPTTRQQRRRLCSDNGTDNDICHQQWSRDSRSFSPESPNASNNNLAGMNYVTSTSSLFGMDIAHPSDGKLNNNEGNADGFQVSLAMPPASGGSNLQSINRRKSDSSFGSVGLTLEGAGGGRERDLVTPPTLPDASTPPPLSPKEGYLMVNDRYTGEFSSGYGGQQEGGSNRVVYEAQLHAKNSPVLQTSSS